jgi:hypothetical protein
MAVLAQALARQTRNASDQAPAQNSGSQGNGNNQDNREDK